MKRKLNLACSSLLISGLCSLAWLSPQTLGQNPVQRTDQPLELRQTPRPTSTPQQSATPNENEDDLVRITTNLVQIDVVVTDGKGNQVEDLTADDFEIQENGRSQKITNFSFVSNESLERLTNATPSNTKSTAPIGVRPAGQPLRTIAIVVDDLAMAFESANHTKRAIRRFIEEGMSPGDQVAIVRTSAGVGALQQFTSDKRQLFAATEHIRTGHQTITGLLQRCQASTFAPSLDPAELTPTGSSANEFDGFREQSLFTGTLGAINFIVRGLGELPGRKALVLISDGLVTCPDEQVKLGTLFEERLRRIADLANRASVVVYSIDPRGLMALDSAANLGGTGNSSATAARLRNATAAIFNSQDSFNPIVSSTGGFSIYNNNDITKALQRVVADQKGYYLIGYRPGDETFDTKKGTPRFNNLKVKLKRPGLTVRTRSGFYGFAEAKGRPARRTRYEQLLGALTSPFSSGSIDVRLTSLFGNEVSGSFMLSMLHIDPAALTFTAQPDGWQQAVMDVLAIVFDADGQVVEEVNKTQTIRARGNTFQRLMKSGLVYSLSVPVKKAGGYQLRIAVRDATSERVGSASQFIEVPDIGKHRLALSGITVRESKLPGEAGSSVDKPAVQPASDNNAREETYSEPQAGPARRRFHQQSVLDYDYVIYNATAGAVPPQLKTQVTVSRNGQQVLAGDLKSFEIGDQPDLARLKAAGRLLLGEALPPGEYILQITVVDGRAKGQYSTTTQWIDFEIVK